MNCPILVHKFKTWHYPFDSDYLDETSELKAHADMIRAKKRGKRPVHLNALDYLDKENLGKVYAGGFIRTLASKGPGKTGVHFESLPNEERKRRISSAWHHHASAHPKFGMTQPQRQAFGRQG